MARYGATDTVQWQLPWEPLCVVTKPSAKAGYKWHASIGIDEVSEHFDIEHKVSRLQDMWQWDAKGGCQALRTNKQTFKLWQPRRAARAKRPNTPRNPAYMQ
jgi:hypothetical protein